MRSWTHSTDNGVHNIRPLQTWTCSPAVSEKRPCSRHCFLLCGNVGLGECLCTCCINVLLKRMLLILLRLTTASWCQTEKDNRTKCDECIMSTMTVRWWVNVDHDHEYKASCLPLLSQPAYLQIQLQFWNFICASCDNCDHQAQMTRCTGYGSDIKSHYWHAALVLLGLESFFVTKTDNLHVFTYFTLGCVTCCKLRAAN